MFRDFSLALLVVVSLARGRMPEAASLPRTRTRILGHSQVAFTKLKMLASSSFTQKTAGFGESLEISANLRYK
jgi:hypothetical protein